MFLDPTTPDQFIAIRNDGTWAGSIDDINEIALSSFATNFFQLANSRSKSRSNPNPQTNGFHAQANGNSKPQLLTPDPATQASYEKWATNTAKMFASALATNTGAKRTPKKLQIRTPSQNSVPSSIPPVANSAPRVKPLTAFPYLPRSITICQLPICTIVKSDPKGLRACRHDVERLLRASGLYSYEWLRQERIRWHPDRFGRLCEESWREEGSRLAEEMFKTIDILMVEMRS